MDFAQFASLREHGGAAVESALKNVSSVKVVVMQSDLVAVLGVFANADLFQRSGVKRVYMIENKAKLEKRPLLTRHETLIAFVRPDPKVAQPLADWIAGHAGSEWNGTLQLLFLGFESLLLVRVLQKCGVNCRVVVRVLPIDAIPISGDLLSVNSADFQRSVEIEGNHSSLSMLSRALLKVEGLFGRIPRLVAVGGSQMASFMRVYEDVHSTASAVLKPGAGGSSLLGAIVLDRFADPVSPLLFQENYLGLLDDCFGLEVGNVLNSLSHADDLDCFNRLIASTKVSPPKSKTNRLVLGQELDVAGAEQNGKILAELADLHLVHVAAKLESLKTSLTKESSVLSSHERLLENLITWLKSSEISQTRLLQGKLVNGTFDKSDVQSVNELMYRQFSKKRVLSLLVLIWVMLGPDCGRGTKQRLKPIVFENWERLFLISYGFEHVNTFQRLERLKVWGPEKTAVSASLKTKTPQAYPRFYGDWTPKAVPIVQAALQCLKEPFDSESRNLEALEELVGPGGKVVTKNLSSVEDPNASVVIVVLVGGCSFAELSFLRAVGQTNQCKLLFLTTHTLNSQTLVSSVL